MSSSFRFPLQRVLDLREQREQRAREELAFGLAHRLRGEALLRQATARAAEARERQHGSVLAGTSAAELQAAQRWVERADQERRAAELDLDRRDAEVRSRRTALQGASRDHEVVARLRERRLAEHERTAAEREQAELDELGLAAHRRGRVA